MRPSRQVLPPVKYADPDAENVIRPDQAEKNL